MIFDMTKRKSGGGEKTFDENADVCFWDYDGTPLYSFSLDEIDQMMTLPVPPDHSQDEVPLTFHQWNWTLADIQDAHIPADVGAIYHPSDGKMHFFYGLTPTTGLTTTFKSTQSGSYYVDWGDGTPIENWGSSTPNGENPTHTYENYGTYHVSVDGKFIPTGPLCVEAPNALIKGIYISANNNAYWLSSYWSNVAVGASVETVTGYIRTSVGYGSTPFDKCPFLKFFVFAPSNEGLSMRECRSLQGVSLPRSARFGTLDHFLYGCTSLRRVRFGDALTKNRFMLGTTPVTFINPPGGFSNNDAANCYSLRRVVVKGNIGSGALAECPIEELWCGMDTVPTLSSSTQFTGLRKNAVFHVKASMLESFKTATNWSAYADYFVGDWTENPDR